MFTFQNIYIACRKANYLNKYEQKRGKMKFEEIKRFLSVQASFA
jgi:guanylate kinase